MRVFSDSDLRSYGIEARQQYDTATQNCWEICHTFGNILIDNGLPPKRDAYTVPEVRVGADNQENHHIIVLPGQYVESASDDETVWIDLSLSQFNDSNKENGIVNVSFGSESEIDDIQILLADDSRRDRYGSIKELLTE